MKKRKHLISLEWDMHMRGHDEPDAMPDRDVSPGNGSCGTWSDISPRSAISVLDPTWVLLGATGYHP
jgi:hypothetical protein